MAGILRSSSKLNRSKSKRYSQPKMPCVTKKKLRFSNGRCLIQKDALCNVSTNERSPKKYGAIRSNVPRALINHSASVSICVTGISSTPIEATSKHIQSSVVTSATTASTSSPALTQTATGLLRLSTPPTRFMLNFRARRSISEMDMKHPRRTVNFALQACESASGDAPSVGKCLYKTDNDLPKVGDEQHPIVAYAGMRMMNAILLNSWRKKREECKHLQVENTKFRGLNGNLRLRIRALEELFQIEQRRNRDLGMMLKESHDEVFKVKKSCEAITTSLISMKSEKALLENQYHIKEQDFDNLSAIVEQTKSQLFRSMSRERELQALLSSQQRKLQIAENQKADLINEICEINNEGLEREIKLQEVIQERDKHLAGTEEEIKSLQSEVAKLKEKERLLETYIVNNAQLKRQVDYLESEVSTLHKCLASTLGNRIRDCWNNSIAYQKSTIQMFHLCAYYMLPATPPPTITRFPFRLVMEKALSIVKR